MQKAAGGTASTPSTLVAGSDEVVQENPGPPRLSAEEALAKAQVACSKAEAALVEALADLDESWHEEVASARGTLSTVLRMLRGGWPGGKKES